MAYDFSDYGHLYTLKGLLDFLHCRLGVVPQKGIHGHDKSWSAETAL